MDEERIREINKVVERIMEMKEEEITKRAKEKEEVEEKFKCPECGKDIRASQVYCGDCGVELEWED